jgi:glyoxylase-like metal-dependent hydrolase (beta-lactamase superfamily II)
MNRLINIIVVTIMAVSFCLPAAADETRTETPIEISPINDHLYIVTCTGGEEFGQPPFGINLVASIGPDGILLVDAGFAATAEALRDTLSTFGNGQVEIIISTHFHGDHNFGNYVFRDDARIIGHQNT